MTFSKVISAVLLIGLVGCVVSEEFGAEHIAHLTGDNYSDSINDGKVYFIKYYAPWCGHCKRLAPVWKELSDELTSNTNIVIAHIDCTEARETCQSAQVKGYPTLKVVHKGEEVETYRGARDLPSLKQFIVETAEGL